MSRIAADGTNVYWTTSGNSGYVMKAPTNGGNATGLASNQVDAGDLASDGTNLYWVTKGMPVNTTYDGTLMKVPVAGGTPVTLASAQYPLAMTIDGTNAYMVGIANGTSTNYIVSKCALGGCNQTPTVLANAMTFSNAVAVAGGIAYWSDIVGSTPSIMKVPTTGGTPTTFLSPQWASLMVANGASLYWSNNTGSVAPGIYKAPLSGGSAVLLSPATADSMVVDATGIYIVTLGIPNCGRVAIAKILLAGGAPTVLALPDLDLPAEVVQGVAVDANGIYWGAITAGASDLTIFHASKQ